MPFDYQHYPIYKNGERESRQSIQDVFGRADGGKSGFPADFRELKMVLRERLRERERSGEIDPLRLRALEILFLIFSERGEENVGQHLSSVVGIWMLA